VARKKDAQESAMRRITIRMPHEIHAALLERREVTGQSLNDMLVAAAARLVGISTPRIQKGIPGRKPGRKE